MCWVLLPGPLTQLCAAGGKGAYSHTCAAGWPRLPSSDGRDRDGCMRRLTALKAAADNRHLEVAIALGVFADRADVNDAIKVMTPQDRRRFLLALQTGSSDRKPEGTEEETPAHSTA